MPPAPVTVEDTGIERTMLINLLAKHMSVGGTCTATWLSGEIKLSKLIVNVLLKDMQALQLIESRGVDANSTHSDIRYALTSKGNAWVQDAMAVSQYVGPAPITLESFVEKVKSQSIHNEEIHRDDLTNCLSHLILPDYMALQLGPAANSGKSVLLHGEPGNGKTSIAEALGGAFKDTIAIPYAIAIGNQIISFFDETVHQPADLDGKELSATKLDLRWVPCKRPVIVTGGELTLDMLDLIYNPVSKFYEAPVHLKALGGIFIIDDFGRQQTSPRDILNRWIIPLEKEHDYLTLHTGRKFSVPFDQLVIFSTNLGVEEVSDAAALRRIYFKIFVPSPTRDDYIEIFRNAAKNAGLKFEEKVISEFFDDVYTKQGMVTSGAHPGFLINHIIAACAYHDKKPSLSRSLLDLAWKNVAATKARDKSTSVRSK